MKYRIALGALLAVTPLAPAAAMPVSTFLTKAEAVEHKGALAMFSSDLKLLLNQIKQDSAQLRGENKAAEAAGRKKAYCTPPGGVKLSNTEILAAMRAVPAARRPMTSTTDAMRAYFARRFPCKA